MTVNYNTFLSDAFLRSHWAEDYLKFKDSPDEKALIDRLKSWHGRKDYLVGRSLDEYFDPKGTDIWERIRSLFRAMDQGGTFRPDKKIGRFNGGLFRQDAEIDFLRITNAVFCERGQGANEASLRQRQDNLLYLCAAYNYADTGGADKTLGLYTLGHIFEQSITELEIKEAEVDNRPSVNKLSKRKTDARSRRAGTNRCGVRRARTVQNGPERFRTGRIGS